MHHYDPPAELADTVFDPTSDTFGPIMAALQAGEFETAAALTASLAGPRFTLSIELGNEDMQSDEDVARALHRLGSWFQENSTMFEQRGGYALDDNGNTVGRWRVDG